ncbi:hypothetical protein LCGC14_1950260 [marine sediment metagenome]|uniref:DUF4406 domain-containing protein n=1 Tax=marine sediment metagenome TaxID=412755 RepID=A0A0F9FHM2_9ZZZZ
MKPRPLVVVVGKFRDLTPSGILHNIEIAKTAAVELWAEGFWVFCPHANMGMSELWELEDHQPFMDMVLHLIDQVADVLYALPNWATSPGSQAEVEFARGIDVPVFINMESICAWRDKIWRPSQFQS